MNYYDFLFQLVERGCNFIAEIDFNVLLSFKCFFKFPVKSSSCFSSSFFSKSFSN